MYMAQVCSYICCRDSVWVCVNVCCVAAVVKDSFFFSFGVLKYVLYVCIRGVMDVVFSVCIVTRGAVGARAWEI